MKPRVLFTVDSFAELGLFGQLQPLLFALCELKFDVHVVSLANASLAPPINDAIEFHLAGRSKRKLKNWHGLRQLIQDLRPDIIHGWGQSTHTAIKLADFGSAKRRLFSHFSHPSWSGSFQDLLSKSLRAKRDTDVYSHSSLPNSINHGQIRIVPNAISARCADRREAKQHLLKMIQAKTKDVFLAGTVSSYEPKYRLKDLVWATDLLCCVRQDVHLLIFGSGDPRPLRRFINNTEAGNNVHLFDMTAANASMLGGLDFYWNAQREHPNPTAMINCLASGVPAISVFDDETSDLILPLQTGLATNYGARDEFARWTKFLIEQKSAASQLSDQGKAHVEKLFATQLMVDSYVKIYDES